MSQSRRQSLIEAFTNIGVGYTVNFIANVVIFHLYHWQLSTSQNLELGIIYTVISLVRSYLLRRLFNRWHR